MVYSFAIWAVIMVFPTAFAGIFTPDATLIDFTAKALRIYCAVQKIVEIIIVICRRVKYNKEKSSYTEETI